MKGMQKVSRGRGFRGTLNYAFERKDGKDQGILIGGTMAGTSINSLSTEFGRFRKLREDIEKPVWHQSLRLPKGESLNSETWNKIGNDYMTRMGFDEDKNQYAFILHDDDHIHIIANRIDIDGKLWYGKNENIESTRHIAQLEKDYGLTITKNLDYTQDELGNWKTAPGQTNLTKVNISRKERHMDIVNENKAFNNNSFYEGSTRTRLTNRINEALNGGPTTTMDFIKRVEEDEKVKVYATVKLGDVAGLSFRFEDINFKGSEVGANWKELTTIKGVNYDKSRDFTELQDPSRKFSSSKQADRKPKARTKKPTTTNNPNRDSTGQFSASRNSPGELERNMPYRKPDVKIDAGTVRRDNDLSKRVGDSIPRPTISRVSTTDDYVKRISPIVPNIIERKPANIEPNSANGIRRQRDTKEISGRATEVNAGNESSRWDSNTKIDMENKVKIQPIPVFNNNFSYWNDVFDIPSTHDNMGDSSNNTHGNTNGASTEKTTSSATTNPITTTASTAAQEWNQWKDSMIFSASLNKDHYLLTNRNFRAGLSEKDKIGLNSLCEDEYKKSPQQRLSDIDKRVDFYISKIPNATVDDRKKSYELHYLESYKRVLLEEENIEYRKKAQQPLKPAMTPAPTQEDEEANAASKALNAIVVKDEQDAANKAAGKDKCRPGTDTSIGNC